MSELYPIRKVWKTQTQLGLILGKHSIQIGNQLKTLGLKNSQGPTHRAVQEGFGKKVGGRLLWNETMVRPLLEKSMAVNDSNSKPRILPQKGNTPTKHAPRPDRVTI